MKRLILIDSHAIIHRAYHALPPLTSSSGEPINAVYGFTSIFLRIIRELKPQYIAAAYDLAGPTFRHAAYERYKAHRPETPSDLSSQFAKTEEILKAFRVPVFKLEGYEADDIIGTIVKKLEGDRDVEIIIVTGDADALQLVRAGVKVYAMKKGISETVMYDEHAVRERFGFPPALLIDFKGLKGDPSDNIPGVKGIGEKTATELVKTFGTVERIYEELKKNPEKFSLSVADRLREGEEDARVSKELARVNAKVPFDFALDKALWRDGSHSEQVRQTFLRFGFASLLRRYEAGISPTRGEEKKIALQPTLLETQKYPAEIEILDAKSAEKKIKSAGTVDAGLILWEGELFLIPRGEKKILGLSAALGSPSAKTIKNFLEKSRSIYCYDAKSIIRFLRRFDIELAPVRFDMMLASYVANFGREFSFAAIAERELGRPASDDARYEFVRFFDIVSSLEAKLKEGRLAEVYNTIELPMARILAGMEELGIKINGDFLKKLAEGCNNEIEKISGEIYQLAGEEFNINSSQQLSRVLFEKMGIRTAGLRKTEKGGVVSTKESELEKLRDANPIISKILAHRELRKLKTTYIDVLPRLADKKTGRIHTTLNQTGTVTGRLSSSNPNLQNIPVASEYGREIRKAFTAPRGFLLVSCDYSQIELRVAAHLADDEKMIKAFRAGTDIHAMAAARINNIPLEKVTPELRRAAKTLNFGVLYGMGPQAFAEATGFSREEAKKYIDEYFKEFSGIKNYIEETKRFAEREGYVETLFGRRRYIPEIHSSNWQLKREAERMAVNMPVQGTATGDIVKMAMIAVDEWVRNKKLEGDVRMLLQVHDELLFEIKKEKISSLVPEIKKIMENVARLKAPLAVDVKAGENWGEQKNLEFKS